MKRKRQTHRRLDPNSKEFDKAVEVMQALGCDECYRRLVGEDIKVMGQLWPDKFSPCGWRVVCDPCSDRLDKGR